MPTYEVKVFTGNLNWAGTHNNIFIKLAGTNGESDRTCISTWGGFWIGDQSNFSLSCSESLGDLVMLELDKQPVALWPSDSWFVDKVEVQSPEGKVYKFPIYHWIHDEQVHYFREGTATKLSQDCHHLTLYARERELRHRKEEYWLLELKLTHLENNESPWADMDSIKHMAFCHKTDVTVHVEQNWENDDFFGYQYLNGLNPMLIRRCSSLPTNFPVTEAMLCLEGGRTLAQEMEDGNMFLCDYKMLDGVQTNVINDKVQYLAAPLVLFYKTSDDKLKPLAIQLNQTPAEDNPIFLPTDSKYDWLLAKTFVRAADFMEHELNRHLLRTHLLSEVFSVSLLRNFPRVHPLYKVSSALWHHHWKDKDFFQNSFGLGICPVTTRNMSAPVHYQDKAPMISMSAMDKSQGSPSPSTCGGYEQLLVPHTRYTLQINVLARERLISKDGALTLIGACGVEGMDTILQRALSSVTYSSLCVPDNIKERGVDSVPNYYYRDDALSVWNIVHRFVKGVITHYYKSDEEVRDDSELQAYIKEIFEHGFLSKTESGIPQSFSAVDEVVKFVTMVIFNSSAQHSAVNTGQLDFGDFMPNFPSSLQLAPPTVKGRAKEHTLLETLPDINTSAKTLAALWLLSTQSTDFVPLGQYPQELFTESVPTKLIETFEKELRDYDDAVDSRNENLSLPYTYLKPKLMENSVSL
uniref:Arachidonate 15-lipoxygenase B-like n=1 Tax=Knipowitschia caucasica TaxID=637954 RepID=A0AAV2MQ90_KNICA